MRLQIRCDRVFSFLRFGDDVAHSEELVCHALIVAVLRRHASGLEFIGEQLAIIAQRIDLSGNDRKARQPAQIGPAGATSLGSMSGAKVSSRPRRE